MKPDRFHAIRQFFYANGPSPIAAIAEAAYALLVPGTAVFLDSGTTVLQLARRIRLVPIPPNIVTNCPPAAQVLMDAPGIKLSILGGGLHKENALAVGSVAVDRLDRLWLSHLFLGAGAVGDDGILRSADDREARLNARMVVRSEVRTLLVDSPKFGRRLTHEAAATSQMNRVITDSGLEPRRADEMHPRGVDVQIMAAPERETK